MNHGRVILLSIAMFICLTAISFPQTAAQAIPPKLATDQAIYSIWHVGGTVTITVSRLNINQTYYLWAQRPNQISSRFATITSRNGTATISFSVAAKDPSGTYLASLSTSSLTDTRVAVTHFGIFGTDAKDYQRTGKIIISGGGFASNVTILIGLATGGQTLTGFPQSLRSQLDGGFTYTFKIPPSQNLGALVVTARGSNYDNRSLTSTVSATVNVAPTSISITRGPTPPNGVERTAGVSTSFRLIYADNSPVTTVAAGSSVGIVREPDGTVVSEVPLRSSSTPGIWTAAWVPPPNATLASYHFELVATTFNDSYSNLGHGLAVDSASFGVNVANVGLIYRGNSTLERTQEANIIIAANYHDGSNFENVTNASGKIVDANGASHTLAFNQTLGVFSGHLKIPVSATLGKWTVTSSITDLYGNKASGEFTIQIVNATLKFIVNAPPSERTTIMNVTARITYPDGAFLNPTLISSGFNVTLRHGNFTWTTGMRFNETTFRWVAGYPIPINATVGDYSLGIALLDIYGNGGVYNSTTSVTTAKFVITVPHPKMKANPGNLIDISITVLYPNGSSLGSRGRVIASFTNSSGTFTYPMIYSVGEGTWHEYFTAPDLGLSFGKTMPFSFSAQDQYGNSGAAANAYELDVGAGIGALILSTVIGAIVPIVLLGWAIATISKRRRKHKP